MPRFFLDNEYFSDNKTEVGSQITVSGDDASHIVNSLRIRKGEKAIICSAGGTEYNCSFFDYSKSGKEINAIFTVDSINQTLNEPNYYVTLFQGMPKGKKTDQIIQKSVELGVSKIVFVYSDRSIPEYESEKDEKKKIERYQRIADEAAKQCGRGKLVNVSFIRNVDRAVEEMKKSDVALYLYESEKDLSVKDVLKKDFGSIAFFVGPEGGISERECSVFKENDIEAFSLGKLILRTETASLSFLSMLLYEKEL